MGWTPDESFRFTLILGLRKGLKTCRGLKRQVTEQHEKIIADALAEQLRLSGYRIEHQPPDYRGGIAPTRTVIE